MSRHLLKWLTAACCGLLAACAIITVNVYFPEKDVKQAYKSLDEMLLKQNQEKTGASPTANPPETVPSEPKPQTMLLRRLSEFSFLPSAFAAEDLADTLAVELSSMPDVLKAYEAMNARLGQLNDLRDSGVIGETSQGLVTLRDPAASDKQPVIKAENENRKAVITGMAKAILKINKKPETKENLDHVMGKAAATYAETRREAAKPGWWIQLAKGRWVRK